MLRQALGQAATAVLCSSAAAQHAILMERHALYSSPSINKGERENACTCASRQVRATQAHTHTHMHSCPQPPHGAMCGIYTLAAHPPPRGACTRCAHHLALTRDRAHRFCYVLLALRYTSALNM